MQQMENRRYSQKKRGISNKRPSWIVELDKILIELVNQSKIRELDRAFALFVAGEYSNLNRVEVAESTITVCMLAALLSEQLGQQQVCLKLQSLPGHFSPVYRFANKAALLKILRQFPFVSEGDPATEQLCLFTLDGDRLYLSRYWHYEQSVARQWRSFSAPEFDAGEIKRLLAQLYCGTDTQTLALQPDWQRVAIALACLKSSCVIAGGPGTGKTTTVVRILWMLSKLYQSEENKLPKIRMVAPTGKAAARLTESVSGALDKLPDADVAIPGECSTIHRLLGTIPGSNFFRHNSQRQLNLDVLVVDEASMIDLPLLAKMLDALPEHCRVIMLGDSHQLSSVEVGSVFSDICSLKSNDNAFSESTARQLWQILGTEGYEQLHNITEQNFRDENAFQNHIIYLKKSYRFDANKGIGQLANAINKGNVSGTITALETQSATLTWLQNSSLNQLVDMVLPHFKQLHKAVTEHDVAAAFETLAQSQILAIQKSGKWGVDNINQLILKALVAEKLVPKGMEFYPGRPIMITNNDHQNGLFNGDIGIVFEENVFPETILEAKENSGDTSALLKVWFPDGRGGFRSFLPAQLPPHQTFYAMTTHKSQGSEFSQVILCMPRQKEGNTALLNRELLYTAVTRSKESFVLFGERESIQMSVLNRCQRSSGLAEILV